MLPLIMLLCLGFTGAAFAGTDISTAFGWPVKGTGADIKYISSLDYHRDAHDTTGSSDRAHGGMDITTDTGTKVVAAYKGKVVRVQNGCEHVDAGSSHNCYGKDVDPWGDYGNYVVLQHTVNGATYTSVYGHMKQNSITVKEGATVNKGEVIGKVGSSGGSVAPHLHLEIYDGEFRGTQKDPGIATTRGLTFQYYQNNKEILNGVSIAERAAECSKAFGNWIGKYCGLQNNRYYYGKKEPSFTKIKFDANGGRFLKSSEGSPKTLGIGSVYGALPKPVKADCDLVGWYTAKTGGSEVKPATVYKGGVSTLYARWKKHDGWVIKDKDGKKVYYYYDEYGQLVTDEFRVIDGVTYYLDSYGRKVTDRLVTIKSSRYYFDKKGKMAAKKFVTINGFTYRFSKSGKMLTGMKKVGSYTYYFGNYGQMVKDKVQKIGDTYYYFNKKGHRAEKFWKTINGGKYYFGKDGKLVTGVQKIGGKTYEFTSYGRLKE